MKLTEQDLRPVRETAARITKAVSAVYLGKDEVIEQLLVALFSGGHVLLEEVPGTGKTILARALAQSIEAPFARIQCTPDLLPADVTGSAVFSPKTQRFRFRKGPIHASIVLVDELNRATPRTQSALLEAMAEGQVSADGKRFPLPEPFFLIATENPVESEGTFPLPEAQKDRFMLAITPGYPDGEHEAQIIENQRRPGHPVDDVIPVATGADILACRALTVNIHVQHSVRDYIIGFSAATRADSRIAVGVSPRGSIALYKAAQTLAAIRGRSFVVPEDVKELLIPVFRKRLIVKPEYQMRGYKSENILTEIAASLPVPSFKEQS